MGGPPRRCGPRLAGAGLSFILVLTHCRAMSTLVPLPRALETSTRMGVGGHSLQAQC